MSTADRTDGDSYDTLPPNLKEEVEDAAVTVAAVLKDTRGATLSDIRERIPPMTETWIRSHAAEFSASVIRHYRRMVAA